MARRFDDSPSHQDGVTRREPLVDIHTEPTESAQPTLQLKTGRKRLSDASDTQDQTCDPQTGPKPQRRRLSETAQTKPEEPVSEPRPASGRPRLVNVQSPTAVLEAPGDRGQSRTSGSMPASAQGTMPAPTESHVDSARIAELRTRQSLSFAAAGGLLAALVGSLIWAVVAVVTHVQSSWIAIGVAVLVAGVVRILGRGFTRPFGCLGAGLSLSGCVLGKFLANCMFIAREAELPLTSVLTEINPVAIPRLMAATFHPLDVLFYGLAVYVGYYLSFRRIAEAQISRAQRNP